MDKDIFDIIDQKEFGQLNSIELKEISEFCSSESEFNAIKNTISGTKMTGNGPKLTTRNSTKERLDEAFIKQYANNHKYVSYYWKPLAQIASVFLVVLAGWYFFSENKVTDKVQLASESKTQIEESNIQSESEQLPYEVTSIKETTLQKTKNRSLQNRSESIDLIESRLSETTYEQHAPIQASAVEIKEEATVILDSEVDKKKKEQTFKSFSTPALSVNDIAVDDSKKPAKTTQIYIAPISKQQNVLQYLSFKY